MMGTDIFKIDASWAKKLTFLMNPSVGLLRFQIFLLQRCDVRHSALPGRDGEAHPDDCGPAGDQHSGIDPSRSRYRI